MAMNIEKYSVGKAVHLIQATFKDWNAFKRAMTLEQIERNKGNYVKAQQHELEKHKLLLEIELTLRGLQCEIRGLDEE